MQKNYNWKTKTLCSLLLAYLSHQAPLAALEPFVVRDIQVRGLQSISAGTVFNYLPVKVGDEFDEGRSAEVVRTLFKTGFFKDVRLERQGNILVVLVSEREAISQISITGNKAINTENLLKGLKQVGFTEGEVFDRSLLDRVEQELRRQYFSQGMYAMKLDSKVSSLGGNRVSISLDISEGKPARIKQINIVGNKVYEEKDLLKKFKLTTPTLISFFTKSDQYSKQKLSADLEALRSHYLDNGYINFNIDSTQVSITPDKRDIYLTVNVTEGERFTVSDVKLTGDLIVPQQELFPLVTTLQGGVFSRQEVTKTSTSITERLGDEGYAFANVNAIPEINNENKTVVLTYAVDPGKRAYVRRINFTGNTRTRDEVLRREMRQMEGATISTSKVNRSKVRLQRLGYFEEVNVETPAVPGTNDQVDVNYAVTERPSGNLMLGLGFSQVQGLIFNTNIVQDNFLGSGKRVNFTFNNSEINRRFGLGYTDPYFTIDGISQGFNLSYRESDPGVNNNFVRFNSQVASAGVTFGIPVTEYQFFNLGLEYEHNKLSIPYFPDIKDLSKVIALDQDSAVCKSNNPNPPLTQPQQFACKEGDQFNILRFTTSFAYDSRNKAILPDSGTLHRIRSEIGLPGADLSFYKVDYETHWFYPLSEDFTLALQGQIGYGGSFGNTDELPFFENFYAGGPRTVRGYKENTLGPKIDTDRRALGGNFLVVGNAELILPVPFIEDLKSVRITAFVDMGNVYGVDDDISFDELRFSTGLSGIWVSPFGVLSVSLAHPFNDQKDDITQAFQFTFGTSF
jgi:outer membrane protein insertion porin family